MTVIGNYRATIKQGNLCQVNMFCVAAISQTIIKQIWNAIENKDHLLKTKHFVIEVSKIKEKYHLETGPDLLGFITAWASYKIKQIWYWCQPD
jgi:predicted flavoprotein YhiN